MLYMHYWLIIYEPFFPTKKHRLYPLSSIEKGPIMIVSFVHDIIKPQCFKLIFRLNRMHSCCHFNMSPIHWKFKILYVYP